MSTHRKDKADSPVVRLARGWSRRRTWVAGWLLAALWAGFFPLYSDHRAHRIWGLFAAVGYVLAAAAACRLPRPRARPAALGFALAGAVVLPVLHLALTGQAQSEVRVIERAGALLLEQGTPYLPHPRDSLDYTPYLPGMALFGMPRVLLGDGPGALRLLGDARLWCAAAFFICLCVGRTVLARAAGGDEEARGTARTYATSLSVLVASPLIAMPICVSGVDLPLTGLCCLAIALTGVRRPVAAGLVLAAACSLKWTALPAIVVAVVLLARLGGSRPAVRCALAAVGGTVVLVLPSALVSPGPMVQQVLAFPTGRGDVATPAVGPMPGQLLASSGSLGWYAAVLLLALGGTAMAVWLVVRPPATAVAAADRLGAGLCLAFLLAPAGRFGYFALPLFLMLWIRRADPVHRRKARRPASLTLSPRSARVPTASLLRD
ncbi:hypothetical protein AB0C77_12105 [Streptomyces sp. NPDC048629]|uniref:hypothetical protein n=1 Tax=Streptomyces sp. NPDC048629 TaxID=3154824 RepID=UPI00342A1D35